ncbi:TIGR00341 family protein [Natrarchaeobius halalkaliphilus]|uniref:TIGR00341 family protein n=1 Tax=Natrarchaeobius halalkaliphilus TaxID=1679091 RepID=A0A3N6LSB2_9EURY|nr:TIGR00341 family protein [Natrarchaeobius halalkaliphilus]RQG91427.1 TIGR00341 family protein [Natrarchaeobius halalkaliphilus]
MRLVQVFVPKGDLELVLETADATGLDYAVSEETSRGEFEALVSIPVPPAAVEPLLAELRAAGFDEDSYTVVTAAETIVSSRTDQLIGQFSGTRISREELQTRAEDLAPAASTYFVLLVVSTVIATAGLLLDSAATIIGAMVVAPLMGPALAASVGVVVDDGELATRGVLFQVTGLLATVLTAALIGWLLRGTVLLPPGFDITTVPQIRERITPNFLALFLALGSGVAGVVSLVRNVGSVLVGVAIAVALVPPAATAGLGIAWGHSIVVVTAGTLVLVNMLSINLTALIVLWLSGYRPHRRASVEHVYGRVRSRIVVLVVAIVVLSMVLGGVTYGTYQTAAVEHDVGTELEAMSDDPVFGDLRFQEVAVEYELIDVYTGTEPAVTVLVERPPGEQEPAGFADTVRERLEDATGGDLTVTVELVDTRRSG